MFLQYMLQLTLEEKGSIYRLVEQMIGVKGKRQEKEFGLTHRQRKKIKRE